MSKVYSGVTYSSPAVGTTTFALTSDAGNAIEYLSQDHIKVESSLDGDTWTTLVVTTDYTFNSNGTEIVLVTPTVEDQQIRISRNTPISAQYVTFSDGSLLTSNQLNKAEQFSLFCDQEIVDGNVDFDVDDIGLDSTDDLPEGSVNLYYTDERVEAYVSGEGYIKDAGVTKIIAGNNVSITPAAGTGEVTINSAGGGSGGGVAYRGLIDATQTAPAALLGELYINTATSGTVDSSWTGAAGTTLIGGERLLYNDSDEWDLLPIPPAEQTLQEVLTTGNTADKGIYLTQLTDESEYATLTISEQGNADNFTQIDSQGIEIHSDNALAEISFRGVFDARLDGIYHFVPLTSTSSATFAGKVESAGYRIDLLPALP